MAEENKSNEDSNTVTKGLYNDSLTIENDQTDDNSDDLKKIIQNKEEFINKSKKSKLNKILFGLIGFLLFILIIGIILYFLGFFTPEVDNTIANNEEIITPLTQKEEVPVYKFDIKDINSKKLNEQLSNLTNKNINQEKNEELEKLENERKLIEEQKIKEEEALKLNEETILKEKKALEEKKLELENEKAQLEEMRQEAVKLKKELELSKNKLEMPSIEKKSHNIENEEIKEETNIMSTSTENSKFLKFINVAKIKGQLYKKYLDKIVAIDPNVILCRDDKNKIEIFFGPFNDENERKSLLEKLLKKKFDQAYELEFTQEEFDKRCNY